jgi:DNA-binding transcriptional regulator LsrR (DeoR family)
LFELEARLKAIFGVEDAVVIPPITDDLNMMVHTLGRAGASYLLSRLRDGDVIAIGGGTAVYSVVQAIEPRHAYDVKVVPFLGAVQGRVTTDVNYLATQLATRLGGKAYQLHAPAFVDTKEHREVLMGMRPIKEILDIAREATIALLGVGSVDDEVSRFVQFTALSSQDMCRIAETYGGVGEIAAYVYDVKGHSCADEYAQRVVGLTLDELRKIPFIIGAAATAIKSLPLYGALRGGYLDALITDERATRGVLTFFEQDFRHVGGLTGKQAQEPDGRAASVRSR